MGIITTARSRMTGMVRSRAARRLSAGQRRFWDDNGYLVLPGFFGADQIEPAAALFDKLWAARRDDDRDLVIDVFIDTPHERRIPFRDATDDARTVPYKLNDLYLVNDVVRAMVLNASLVDVIDDLLDGPPIVCNSLSFEKGSQQRFHFDTFYMPPLVPNKMLAAWIALEPADDRAGPLRYYPKSHTIPPFQFTAGLKATLDELPSFDRYIDKELAQRALSWETFPAAPGDVFIWHAQLYHGGTPIEDMSLTRRSLVTHYFRAQDVPQELVADGGDGRYYLRRPHQKT